MKTTVRKNLRRIRKVLTKKDLFDGGLDSDEKDLARERMTLKKRRHGCRLSYDEVHKRVDKYFRAKSRFLYKRRDDSVVGLDFYSHHEQLGMASKRSECKLYGFVFGVDQKPELLYTGKVVFEKDEQYLMDLDELRELNAESHRLNGRIDEIGRELKSCELAKMFLKK